MRNDYNLLSRIKRKASQSTCKSRVAALGFNRRGQCVASAVNRPRLSRKGGGIHAEEQIFKVARKKGITKILICRVGKGGELRPIEACESCSKTAKKLGIDITSVPAIERNKC